MTHGERYRDVLSFEELTASRRSLQSFCLLHCPSLLSLQSGISFKLEPKEADLSATDVVHMTTSATCWTSLFECPPRYGISDVSDLDELRSTFATRALLRPDVEWKSENSASIYCRCRALPLIISSSRESKLDARIERHLDTIFGQLQAQPERFGIGEADPTLRKETWYPPNAFHTYWVLSILDLIESKFAADYARLSQPEALDLPRRRKGMLLWAREKLGHQIGLHSSTPPSSLLDTDQLAWSLAICLRFDEEFDVNLENRDFTKQALNCLFSTQVDGTWRHYKPLFHYEAVGNAYCYVFETFAILLQSALRNAAKSELFRELLEPYSGNLMNLWRHADSTKMNLWEGDGATKKPESATGKEIGWRSGHRMNFSSPESWATASVFSYAQALRRLVGIWCRKKALTDLNSSAPRLKPADAEKEIEDRGQTWGSHNAPVSERLQTMFINPVRMGQLDDNVEPDGQPIEKWQARSAILFGPPGTSKTSLIRSLAEAIEWKYVEIHASHFVAEGLGAVQKTADRIFKQLLELDRTVVLFDEIDELVRERDMEKDAFGRFLTTSMLPKLAELWEARKILYFVATNHINYFDSAIIRSRRFDALILVSPPSFKAKKERLTHLLSEVHGLSGATFEVGEPEIQEKLHAVREAFEKSQTVNSASNSAERKEDPAAKWREQKLDSDLALAKFALLRHDELDELAYRLAAILRKGASRTVSQKVLAEALRGVTDSEWRKNKSYVDFLRDTQSERRDYQMLSVWEVITDEASVPGVEVANGRKWTKKTADSSKDIEMPGFDLRFGMRGRLKIVKAPTL